jgi:hypothetical protein
VGERKHRMRRDISRYAAQRGKRVLRVGQLNAEDTFKSLGYVENKRHTNAHQPSPPTQQKRLQPPLSAIILWEPICIKHEVAAHTL